MSVLLKKRGREDAAEEAAESKRFHGGAEQILNLSAAEPKRFHGGAEQILNLLEEDVEERGGQEQGSAPSEELLSGVIRSLEEEIGVSCSTSYEGSDSSAALSRDGSVVSDMTSGCYGGAEVDIDYLLGASDDELGILPSPVLGFGENEVAPASLEGVSTPLEMENSDLKGLISGGNWHFEDALVDYRQFPVMENDDVADGFDIANFGSFIDGDYSTVWRLETAGGMY